MTPGSSGRWSQTLPCGPDPRVLEAPRNPAAAELSRPPLQPGLRLPPQGPQLRLEEEGGVLNNRLVGLSLGRIRVTALREPVEITFSHPRQPLVSPHPGQQ